MEIEERRNEQHCQHHASGDAPSKLVPHGKQRDFLTDVFSLPVAAIEIIRHQREYRAEHQLKHGRGPPSQLIPPASKRWRSRVRRAKSPAERQRAPLEGSVSVLCPPSSQRILQ